MTLKVSRPDNAVIRAHKVARARLASPLPGLRLERTPTLPGLVSLKVDKSESFVSSYQLVSTLLPMFYCWSRALFVSSICIAPQGESHVLIRENRNRRGLLGKHPSPTVSTFKFAPRIFGNNCSQILGDASRRWPQVRTNQPMIRIAGPR